MIDFRIMNVVAILGFFFFQTLVPLQFGGWTRTVSQDPMTDGQVVVYRIPATNPDGQRNPSMSITCSASNAVVAFSTGTAVSGSTDNGGAQTAKVMIRLDKEPAKTGDFSLEADDHTLVFGPTTIATLLSHKTVLLRFDGHDGSTYTDEFHVASLSADQIAKDCGAAIDSLSQQAPVQTAESPGKPSVVPPPSQPGVETLADLLGSAPDAIGPPPAKYQVPFLVAAVTPIAGSDECGLTVVTNGMMYSLAASSENGACDHLPELNALTWGRIRHSRVLTFLRQSNMANVASDYVDLCGYGTYMIATSDAIGSDWGATVR